MTEEPVTVAPDDDVEVLAELLVKKGANPIPVVDGGRLIGIVSRADIIKMMAQELSESEPGS
jgi:CBS domain-containing protein